MIIYQYRWWCAVLTSLLLMVCAYLIDIQALTHALDQACQQQLRAQAKLDRLAHQSKKMPVYKSQNRVEKDMLSSIMLLMHLHGLTLISSHVTGADVLHFSAQGNYQQLMAFVRQLYQQPSLGSVLNFSYQLTRDPEKMLLVMNINMLADAVSITLPALPDMQSPFCPSLNQMAFLSVQNTAIPPEQMKLTGILQLNEHKAALVVMPSQSVLLVKVGDALGQMGVVTDIKADGVVVNVANKKTTIRW